MNKCKTCKIEVIMGQNGMQTINGTQSEIVYICYNCSSKQYSQLPKKMTKKQFTKIMKSF